MIDHIGFSVSDYARSKTFYESALGPLGYTLVMEVTARRLGNQPPASAAAVNRISGSAAKASWKSLCMSRSSQTLGKPSMRFIVRRLLREVRTMAPLGYVGTTIRVTTLRSYSILMGTTLKRCVTRRLETAR